MTMAPGMAAISQYFQKKRGAAIGIAVAESSVGGVVLPIALGRMLYNPRLGLGWTVRISGFIMLALLLVSTTAIRARLPPRKNQFLLLSAFRNLQYLLIIVAAFLTVLGMFTPIFYLPSHAVQNGMGTQLAFYLVAILNGASFFGRVIPGVTADKVGRFNVLSASALCTGVLILCWQKSKSNASIIVFAALYGLCSVAIVSSMSVCLARVPKDPKDIGTYLGMGMFVLSFGALVGPPINGALVARYGGFDEVSMLSGLVALAGGCVAFLAKQQTDEGLFGRV
ncbi:MAG: alpha-1,2-mannosyltransferase (Kre5) [Chaenotheca gracillima]|nr:MAG: alpha-1,2-mannosyltransferase (Kre5) [Chaenotheca gracillima]